jgi:hypothetical protein
MMALTEILTARSPSHFPPGPLGRLTPQQIEAIIAARPARRPKPFGAGRSTQRNQGPTDHVGISGGKTSRW